MAPGRSRRDTQPVAHRPGALTRDPASGQLVMGLEDMPQLPIEDTEIHFFGGTHASFSTPALCGRYTTTASFTPWSGDEATTASSSFEINTGPDGSGPAGCPAPGQSGGGSESSGGGSSESDAGGGSTAPLTATTPASVTDRTPLVTLVASKLVISRGSASVLVTCSQATCQGSIELTVQWRSSCGPCSWRYHELVASGAALSPR